MQVDVHRVDAEVARAHPPDDRVEVGPVAIDEGPGGVDRVADRDHVGLEQPAGIGVGDHHRGDVGAEAGAHRGEVDPPARVGGDVLDRIAAEGRRRRVGAVRAFGDEDDLAAVGFR